MNRRLLLIAGLAITSGWTHTALAATTVTSTTLNYDANTGFVMHCDNPVVPGADKIAIYGPTVGHDGIFLKSNLDYCGGLNHNVQTDFNPLWPTGTYRFVEYYPTDQTLPFPVFLEDEDQVNPGFIGSVAFTYISSAVIPAPVVTITSSPTTITRGGSSTLTWVSTDATSCIASGAWAPAVTISGTQAVSPTATSTYTLVCTGFGGTATQSTTITVAPVTPPPPSDDCNDRDNKKHDDKKDHKDKKDKKDCKDDDHDDDHDCKNSKPSQNGIKDPRKDCKDSGHDHDNDDKDHNNSKDCKDGKQDSKDNKKNR